MNLKLTYTGIDREEMNDLLGDDLRRAYRRETGSRREVGIYRLNLTGWTPDGSTSHYEGAIIGRRDRSGSYPILGTARVIRHGRA